MFDFDGLIADTETPLFESWCQEFRDHGVELSVHEWIKCVGAGPGGWDVLDHLESLVGSVDRAKLEERNVARHHAALVDLCALPGVVELLDEAQLHGIPCAVASSSGFDWVDGFLRQIGIRERFQSLATRDMVENAKPAPDLFLKACEKLGTEPNSTVALEDSVNGVIAAKSAGLVCVAVPNCVTTHFSFDHADARIDSMDMATIAMLDGLVTRARSQALS